MSQGLKSIVIARPDLWTSDLRTILLKHDRHPDLLLNSLTVTQSRLPLRSFADQPEGLAGEEITGRSLSLQVIERTVDAHPEGNDYLLPDPWLNLHRDT